jgi:isopropylmalate/homocitrate/citramalate synthase
MMEIPDQEKLQKLDDLKKYLKKIGFEVKEDTTMYEVAKFLEMEFKEAKKDVPEKKWFDEVRGYRNNGLSQKAQE